MADGREPPDISLAQLDALIAARLAAEPASVRSRVPLMAAALLPGRVVEIPPEDGAGGLVPPPGPPLDTSRIST